MKTKIHIITILVTSILVVSCTTKKQEIRPERKDIIEYIYGSGTLESENEYQLIALTDGYITQINFKENDYVKSGEIFAVQNNQENELNSDFAIELNKEALKKINNSGPELSQIQAQLNIAELAVQTDSINWRRNQQLQEINSISISVLEQAELAYRKSKMDRDNLRRQFLSKKSSLTENYLTNSSRMEIYKLYKSLQNIKVPISGKVLKRFKKAGDYVRKGDLIAQIGNLENVFLLTEVDEKSISKIKTGQVAVIRFNALPEQLFKGEVKEVWPAYDEEKQSYLVRIEPKELPIRPILGAQAQINIEVRRDTNALLIPKAYLNSRNQVRLKGEKTPVEVKINYISNEWANIASGLNEDSVLEPFTTEE